MIPTSLIDRRVSWKEQAGPNSAPVVRVGTIRAVGICDGQFMAVVEPEDGSEFEQLHVEWLTTAAEASP